MCPDEAFDALDCDGDGDVDVQEMMKNLGWVGRRSCYFICFHWIIVQFVRVRTNKGNARCDRLLPLPRALISARTSRLIPPSHLTTAAPLSLLPRALP